MLIDYINSYLNLKCRIILIKVSFSRKSWLTINIQEQENHKRCPQHRTGNNTTVSQDKHIALQIDMIKLKTASRKLNYNTTKYPLYTLDKKSVTLLQQRS